MFLFLILPKIDVGVYLGSPPLEDPLEGVKLYANYYCSGNKT